MKDSLLQETLNSYTKVISIYKNTGYNKNYKLNTFWSDVNMKDMLKVLNDSHSAIEAVHAVQATWMFSVNTADSIKEKAIDWLLANQQKRGLNIFDMSSSIQESPISNPGNNVLRRGKIFTPDFLRTVNVLHEIKTYCKIEKSRLHVVELGAGCGHLARTIRLFIPDCSYVILDIPETLSFSYMFLKLNFPGLKTVYITDEQQLKEIPIDEFDYIFVPTKFAEGVLGNKFDIFINTASLGEMKNDVIHYWMDFIQNKLKVKYLFTLNRFLNTIKTDGSNDWRLEENECSVLYDANWKIMNWELEPSFTRCPYMDTIIARYVEIVAEKMPSVSIADNKKRSQQLLCEVMEEDWVRLEDSFAPEMTYRDNILVNDTTMNGALFKLWESMRLDKNERNVVLMLKLLETLLHKQDKEFEETYYYEDQFNNLFVSKDNKDLVKIYDSIARKRSYRKSFPQSVPSLFKLKESAFIPILEEYEGYNIVKWGASYWALLKSLGPIDFFQPGVDNVLEKYRAQGKCFSGNSLFEMKYHIATSKNSALQTSFFRKHSDSQ